MEPKTIIFLSTLLSALCLFALLFWREGKKMKREAGVTSYATMPLGVYLDVLEIATGKEPEDALPEIMAKVLGRPIEDVLNMTLPEYSAAAADLGWLEDDPKPAKIRRAYDCGPFRLVIPRDVTGLSASQYIDAQTIIQDPADRLPDMLALLMIPEGHKYADGYDLADVRAAILEHLSVLDAVAVRDFFVDCSKRLTKRFLSSSGAMTKRALANPKLTPMKRAELEENLTALKRMKADLARGGDGSRASMTYLSLPVALGRLRLKCL